MKCPRCGYELAEHKWTEQLVESSLSQEEIQKRYEKFLTPEAIEKHKPPYLGCVFYDFESKHVFYYTDRWLMVKYEKVQRDEV